MGGMVGRVFREFAVTIAVAIIVSGFVSFTLTPMLCARVLRSHHRRRQAEHRAARFRSHVQWLAARLRVVSREGARLQVPDPDGYVATLGATVWLYIIIPKGFFPTEDTGFLAASTEASSDVSFAQMAALQRQVSALVRTDKAVDYVNSTVGAGGPIRH